MITHVLEKVSSLFLMLLIGGVARAAKVITDEALDSLCRIVLDVTLPFLFIYVLASRCFGSGILSLWVMPFSSLVIILAGFAVGTIAAAALKLKSKRRDTFIFLSAFQNSGFLAIPVAFALFGEEGVLNVVVFNIGYNLLLWTFGIWLLGRSERKFSMRSLCNLLNPGIIALAIGVILGVSCVKLPHFFMDTSRLIGDATVPMSMVAAGAILVSGELKRGGRFKEMAALIACKLIFMPVILLGAARVIGGMGSLDRSVIILQACMPSAASSALFAKRFGGDYELASSGVFFTTLVSIITIPVFMSVI